MSILQRINAALTPTTEQPVHESERLANILSGAFHKPVRVKVHEGRMFAFIPADDFKASGIVVTESAIREVAPIVTGSPKAVENAERRVAKLAGPGYVATISTFDASTRLCSFEVARAGA